MTSDPSNKEPNKAEHELDPISVEVSGYGYYDWESEWESESGFLLPLSPLAIAWFGIIIASLCYPVVVGGIMFVYGLLTSGLVELEGDTIRTAFQFLFISSGFTLVYGTIISLPAFFLTKVLSWSLKGMISDRGASAVFGGLTGFLAASGGGLFFASDPGLPTPERFVFYGWLPFTAIVMGHTGAVVSGYSRRYRGFPFFDPLFNFRKQITISFLLKLTSIVAVLAVVFKAVGAFAQDIGISWLAYVLVQMLLLIVDHWITRWLGRRYTSVR